MDEAEKPSQQLMPKISTNTKVSMPAVQQHSMARAVAHLNKQTERGEHGPVPGIMAG